MSLFFKAPLIRVPSPRLCFRFCDSDGKCLCHSGQGGTGRSGARTGCCHVAGAALTVCTSVAFSVRQTERAPGPPGLESLVRIPIVPAPGAELV